VGKPKAAAKAAAQTTRAPKKPRTSVPAHLLVPVDAGDWPTNLDDKVAEALFKAMEGGLFLRKAAKACGLESATVRQWKHRHPKFAERLAEAEEIGKQELVEEIDEFSEGVIDRDSAAAAKAKLECRMEALRGRYPQDFKTSPFKPASAGSAEVIVGVVIVPQRSETAGLLPAQRQPIDGTATVIERLPMNDKPAPAFKVTADG